MSGCIPARPFPGMTTCPKRSPVGRMLPKPSPWRAVVAPLFIPVYGLGGFFMASRKLARKIDMEAEREARALVWFKQNGLSQNQLGASRKFFHGTSRKKRLPLPRSRGGPAGGSESGSVRATWWLSGCNRGRDTRRISPGAGVIFPYPRGFFSWPKWSGQGCLEGVRGWPVDSWSVPAG